MSAIEKLEQRLAVLEAEVASLKKEKTHAPQPTRPWWEEWFGAFENDPYFEEAMKYGRKWRESTRPKPKKRRKLKNGRP